jgi:hypothetical protein
MLGHETVTAGIAGPEIADDVVGKKSRSFRSHHGVSANRARRQIASARVGVGRDGRADFSNCCHRDLLCDLKLGLAYTDLFDVVATEMRWFYDIWLFKNFAMQRILLSR